MAAIVLADDEVEAITAAAEYLSDCGHVCSVFCDARCAREAIAVCDVDVLVTDLMMPFIDGCMLISDLRARQMSRKPAVILMSPMMADSEPLHDWSFPVDVYLLKPCGHWDIVLAVEAVLKWRGQLLTPGS